MADNILYLSPAGGSGLRIRDVFECRRKVLLKRRGWKFKRVPSGLWFGGRIHHFAFMPYLDPKGISDLAAQAREDITNIVASGKLPYEYTDKKTGELVKGESAAEVREQDADLPRVAEAQMDVWVEKLYRPEDVCGCETKMIADPVDPKTGQVSNEAAELRFKIVGRSDLMLGTPGNPRAIRDLKTCAAPLKDIAVSEFDYHFQLSTYRYLNAAMTAKDISDVGFFQLVKYKTVASILKYAVDIPLVRALPFKTVYDVILEAAKRLRRCEAKAEQGNPEDAWPRDYACETGFKVCEFLPLCFPEKWGTQSELDTFVSENLVKTERG